MPDLSEEEKLALEAAAREEGRKQEEQDNAIRDAAQEALDARLEAMATKSMLDDMANIVTDIANRVGALEAMAGSIIARVDELEKETVVVEEVKEEVKEEKPKEETPPPAVEPKKRVRKWA